MGTKTSYADNDVSQFVIFVQCFCWKSWQKRVLYWQTLFKTDCQKGLKHPTTNQTLFTLLLRRSIAWATQGVERTHETCWDHVTCKMVHLNSKANQTWHSWVTAPFHNWQWQTTPASTSTQDGFGDTRQIGDTLVSVLYTVGTLNHLRLARQLQCQHYAESTTGHPSWTNDGLRGIIHLRLQHNTKAVAAV